MQRGANAHTVFTALPVQCSYQKKVPAWLLTTQKSDHFIIHTWQQHYQSEIPYGWFAVDTARP